MTLTCKILCKCYQAKLITLERTHYLIMMDVLPAQESYEIGSQVRINCTVVYPTVSPTSYRWTSTYGAISSTSTTANTLTITVPVHHPQSVNYYCQPMSNGRLLGTQKIMLNVKGIMHNLCIKPKQLSLFL